MFLLAPFVAALVALGISHPPDGGEETWEAVPSWAQGEDTGTLGNTHGGVVIDKAGRIYSNTDTQRAIVIHEPDGTYVGAIASAYPGIHAMVLREEDGVEYIYAAHLHGKQTLKLRLDGTLVWALGVPMESGKYDGNPNAFSPTGIAVGPAGEVYVADGYGRQWVHIFSPGLKYIKSFGGRGSNPGQFQTCHGLALDDRTTPARLLVCDRENRRIQRFDLEGNFIDTPATGLRRPCAISVGTTELAIAELEGRVTILGENFEVIDHVGDNPDTSQWAKNGVPASAWKDGVFTAPHGCCFDADGNLYVSDWNATGRLSRINRVSLD
jgi:hypothetical protein